MILAEQHMEDLAKTRRRRNRIILICVVVVIGAYAARTTHDRRWIRAERRVVRYGSHIDQTAVVYEGTNGRILVNLPAEDLSHPDHYVYLIDTLNKYVCLAGRPYWYRGQHFAITTEDNPCEFVLNGIIEPPSLDAKLQINNGIVEFTAWNGQRVSISK